MKTFQLSMLFLAGTLACTSPAYAAPDDTDLGFAAAFPRPIHKKKNFGLLVTGASVVAAGTFSYFTAGAGAPPAAGGVGAVASWVGGGSYMAGASIVGGWFGGNAMLGAAVLNGLSIGTVGAGGAWASLSAGQKALALASTTATIMDGVAIVSKPETQQLEWRMLLPVPIDLADKRTRGLLDASIKAREDIVERDSDLLSARSAQLELPPGAPKSAKLLEAERALEAAKALYTTAENQIQEEIGQVLKSGASNRATVLMAVLAQNSGRSADFRELLGRVKADSLKGRSYLEYLRAVANLQLGKISEAERRLQESRRAASYAIEPAILLAGIAATKGFKAQETKVDEIAAFADKNFDSDKYMTPASLVSLHYRIGTMALAAKRCDRALSAIKKAQSKHSLISKYWTGKEIRTFLEIGEANALLCQGNRNESYAVFNKVWQRTTGREEREMLCAQYSGGCSR